MELVLIPGSTVKSVENNCNACPTECSVNGPLVVPSVSTYSTEYGPFTVDVCARYNQVFLIQLVYAQRVRLPELLIFLEPLAVGREISSLLLS